MLNDEDFIKIESIKSLSKIHSKSSKKALRKFLQDKSDEIRWTAAHELAYFFNDEEALPILKKHLGDDKNHLKAFVALERIFKDRIISLLGEILDNDSPQIRRKAVTNLILSIEKGYGGILPLLNKALHDQDSQVRKLAVQGIIKVNSESANSLLAKAWSDEDLGVRILVHSAKNAKKYLKASLAKALVEEDIILRKRAIETIQHTQVESKDIVNALLKIHFFDTNSLIQVSASVALTMIGSPTVIKALGKVLEEDEIQLSKYRRSHSAAISLLTQIKHKDSIFVLVKLLIDQHKSLFDRGLAVKALGSLGDSSVIPILKETLKSINDNELALDILFALGKLGVQNLEDVIIAAMQSARFAPNRKEAIYTLAKINTEKARIGLLKSLNDTEFTVRFVAAKILAKRKSVESIPTLLERLNYRNPMAFSSSSVVFKDAIDAFKDLGEIALPKLEAELKTQDLNLQRKLKLVIEHIKLQSEKKEYPHNSPYHIPENYADTLINRISERHTFSELLEMLSLADAQEAWKFSSALIKTGQPENVEILYQKLLASESDTIFLYIPNVIKNIQEKAQFYNYDLCYSCRVG